MKIRARVQSAVVEGDMIRVKLTGQESAAADYYPTSHIEFTCRDIASNRATYVLGRWVTIDLRPGGHLR